MKPGEQTPQQALAEAEEIIHSLYQRIALYEGRDICQSCGQHGACDVRGRCNIETRLCDTCRPKHRAFTPYTAGTILCPRCSSTEHLSSWTDDGTNNTASMWCTTCSHSVTLIHSNPPPIDSGFILCDLFEDRMIEAKAKL